VDTRRQIRDVLVNPATGATDLWTKRADGGAQALMQLHKKWNLYNPRWSPDGKWMLFQTDIA